ncbi:MAG: MATE family efflux transporter [Eubacteriales bacterium]
MKPFLRKEKVFYGNVFRLTIPIVLQNIITSTLAMMDTFMVGLLGEAEMAALTLANIPIFVVQLLFFGVNSGAAVLISQYWGRENHDGIQQVAGVAMGVVATISFTVAMVLYFIPTQFLGLFGKDLTVVALAAEYGQIIGITYFLNSFTLQYIGIYRSIGKPILGTCMLGVSMVANVFFNWIFIFGNFGAPAMGVRGAAVGTLIARVLEIIIMIGHILWLKKSPDKFSLNLKRMVHPEWATIVKFMQCSAPAIVNEGLWGLGTMVFPTIMGHMDDSVEILAAYTLVGNIEKLIMVAGFGLAASAAIIVGRDIGTGENKESVKNTGMTLSLLGFCSGILSGGLMIFVGVVIIPPVFSPIFQLSVLTTEIAITMSILLGITMSLRTFNCVAVVGVMRGGGDVRVAAVIDVAPLWLVSVPLAYLIGVTLHMSIFWVYIAMSAEHVVKFLLGISRLCTTKWVKDLSTTK